jgi:hypothetical protein
MELRDAVKNLLYFAKDGNDVLPPAKVLEKYEIEPAGVNFYYGLNADALAQMQANGTALRENHLAFFKMLRESLLLIEMERKVESERKTFLLNLGLWPFEPGMPYQFVEEHPELVVKVAEDLQAQRMLFAAETNKQLDIVVRYASEMNDPMKPGQPWGRPFGFWDPAHARPFRDTFQNVRRIFRKVAPEVRFAFSPAIRSDITGDRYDLISDFWPGDEGVDLISCTWYAGQAAHVTGAAAALERYFKEMQRYGRPFALDEMGGIDGMTGNDAVLEQMFKALVQIGERIPAAASLEYATMFLHGKWGTDATLKFLREVDPLTGKPQ